MSPDRYQDIIVFHLRLHENKGTIPLTNSFEKDVDRPTLGDRPIILETTGKATIEVTEDHDTAYLVRLHTPEGEIVNATHEDNIAPPIRNHLTETETFHIPEAYATLKLSEDEPTLEENATLMQLGYNPYEN